MKLSIIIPVFNEEKTVKELIERVISVKIPGVEKEIIVVDDGSNDEGYKSVKGKSVILIRHKINLGKGAAMKTGADFAFGKGAEAVIFMDSDGQHNASDLPLFLNELKKSKHVIVFGTRNLKGKSPAVRFVGNRIASFIIKLLFGIFVTDSLCGFRAMTAKAYSQIRWESPGYGVESEIVAKVSRSGLSYIEVPVRTIYLDNNKGVSLLDALGIFTEIIKWKLVN